MEKIDAAGAFALLERVVAERGGDYVYRRPEGGTKCFYVHEATDGTTVPGCAVGLAASYVGVDFQTLAMWDGEGSVYDITQDKFDEDAIEVLSAFQGRQDSRLPYEEALEAARQRLADVLAA